MDDLNKPIRPISRDEKDRFKVQKIEAYKQQEEELRRLQKEISEHTKSDQAVSTTFLMFFKKIFNKLIPEKEGVQSLLSQDQVLTDLKTLKTLLLAIRDEDPENDPQFAERFSFAWHNLMTHYLHHAKLKLPTKVDLKLVGIFLQALQHFPSNTEHTLAFYLNKYREEQWFPKPFFELIGKLHDDYFELGQKSELDQWIDLLAKTIHNAQKN